MPKKFPAKDGKTTFGMHLMLDAYGVPFDKLDDMKLVFKFLTEVSKVIGMVPISTPFVVNADETSSGFDPGGISGFVMIQESHISLHTFSKRGFFSLDVYSCSNFEDEIENLLDYVKKIYPYKEKELQIVKRGLTYPTENS